MDGSTFSCEFSFHRAVNKIIVDGFMEDYIFGIKCKGVSIMVSEISIDDDQSNFDFICNASVASSYNGNGSYDVSIINKNYVKGMNVGEWRIIKAGIDYDWGDSYAYFCMEDNGGNRTDEIIASTQRGSASGFSVPSLVKSIFTKAQSVVRDYPNAAVLNVVQDFYKACGKINVKFLKGYLEGEGKSDEKYLGNVGYVISELSDLFIAYKKAKKVLDEQEDPKSEQLLKDVMSKCKQLLDSLRE